MWALDGKYQLSLHGDELQKESSKEGEGSAHVLLQLPRLLAWADRMPKGLVLAMVFTVTL